MNEMKPCPICKREHEIDIDAEFGGVMFRHKNFDWNKDQCLLAEQELSENVSVDRFVEIWNSRPIEDQLKAENERLREALQSMFDTCMKADEQGELSELISGELLDSVGALLGYTPENEKKKNRELIEAIAEALNEVKE